MNAYSKYCVCYMPGELGARSVILSLSHPSTFPHPLVKSFAKGNNCHFSESIGVRIVRDSGGTL
jgi:hypothetical protein